MLACTACIGNVGSPFGGNPDASEAGKAGDGAGEEGSEEKPYELVLVFPASPQRDEKLVEEALNKLLIEKINATIDLRPIDWGQWEETRNLMIGAREKVDIYFTAQWTGHAVNVAQGAFLPLNDLLQTHGRGILETLDPVILEGSKINGINYSVPTNKEFAEQGGIIYRTDVAEQLNLDMSQVKTVADLEPIFAKVKAETDMIPLFVRDGENFGTHYISNLDFLGDAKIDGVILKDGTDTTVRSMLETPRYLDMLAIARDFYEKGYVNADAASTKTFTTDALKSGQYFAIVASLKPGKDKETELAAGLVGKLGQIPLNEATITTGVTTGAMLAISATSENPEKAMAFINLLHTDKAIINLLNFGIEGVHYTRNGEIISPTDRTPDYALNAAWEFGNQFLNYVWESESPTKWEEFARFNEQGYRSPAFGFAFDSRPVEAEVAALFNVMNQYRTSLETGAINPAEYVPRVLEAAKAAGLDAIIAEKQRQLDQFLANR
jgi:putative aldouronate transport system substrate-binding protein